MMEEVRYLSIKRLLARKTFASVGEIATYLEVSEATVRRDLAKMEETGDLKRVRGGARANRGQSGNGGFLSEPSFEQRTGQFLELKRGIAEKAVRLCGDGETIIIDGGSTTYRMTEFLKDRELTIITNSFAIAEALVRISKNTIILPGGIVYPESMLLLDHFTTEYYGNFSVDKVFMGVAGIDERGMTNTDTLLIQTERCMIERAREVYILADSSKFNRRGNLRLCGFDKVTAVITDAGIDKGAKKLLADFNVSYFTT